MLKALLAIGGLQLLTMIAMLVRTKALAVLLGAEHVGALAVIDKLVALVAQTISLSLPFAALRFLPALWKSDAQQFEALTARMRDLLILLAVLAALVCMAVTAFDPDLWGEEFAALERPVMAAFAALPVIVLVPFIQSVVAARLQQNRAMAVALGHAVVATLAAVVGVWRWGLTGLYATYAILGTVYTAAALWRLRGGLPRMPLRETGIVGRIIRFSSAMLMVAFAAPYAALYVHYQVLQEHGAVASGWMQSALGIALAVRMALGAAHGVFLTPNVNRGTTPRDQFEWAVTFQRVLCVLLLLVVPPLLLLPQLAVRVLYSEAFLPGARFVALFVSVEVIAMLSATYQSLILAQDRLKFHVAQNLAGQAIMVGAGSVLVPRFGIAGAAAAALLTPVFMYVSTLLFLRKHFDLRLPRAAQGLTALMVAALATAGIAGVYLSASRWDAMAGRLVLYLVLVGAAIPLLTPDERGRLRQSAGAALHRIRNAGSA